jgi:hypothetical protein
MAAAQDQARVPLNLVPRLLRERNITRTPPSYRRIYLAVLDGRVPAERAANGRWSVRICDLKLIAETLNDATAVAA